jgi:hypothetical protein
VALLLQSVNGGTALSLSKAVCLAG